MIYKQSGRTVCIKRHAKSSDQALEQSQSTPVLEQIQSLQSLSYRRPILQNQNLFPAKMERQINAPLLSQRTSARRTVGTHFFAETAVGGAHEPWISCKK